MCFSLALRVQNIEYLLDVHKPILYAMFRIWNPGHDSVAGWKATTGTNWTSNCDVYKQ